MPPPPPKKRGTPRAKPSPKASPIAQPTSPELEPEAIGSPPPTPPLISTASSGGGDQPAWDIFISYNPTNSWAQCCCIALELRKIGIKVWFDMATDVSKGGSVQGIDNCKSFVLFVNDRTFENYNVQDDVRQALKAKKPILIVYEVDYAKGALFDQQGEFDFKACLYDQAPAEDLRELYTLWEEGKIPALEFARADEEEGVLRMKLIVQILTQSGLSHDNFFANRKEIAAAAENSKFDFTIVFNPAYSADRVDVLKLDLEQLKFVVDVVYHTLTFNITKCRAIIVFLSEGVCQLQPVQDAIRFAIQMKLPIIYVYETDARFGACFHDKGSFDFKLALGDLLINEDLEEEKKQEEEEAQAKAQAQAEADSKSTSSSIFSNPFGSSGKKKRRDKDKPKIEAPPAPDAEKSTAESTDIAPTDATSEGGAVAAEEGGGAAAEEGGGAAEEGGGGGAAAAEGGGDGAATTAEEGGASLTGKMSSKVEEDSDEEEAPPPIPPPTNLLDLKKVTRDAVPFYRRFKYRKTMLEAITTRGGLKGKKRRPPAPPTRRGSSTNISPNSFLDFLPKIDSSVLHIGDCIGKGTFGKLYEGKWKRVRVAVKEIPGDVEVLLAQEGELLAKLHHVNIMRVFGTTVMAKDSLCLVLEHVGGGNLYEFLHGDKGKKPLLPMDWVLSMLFDVAEALDYLHNQSPNPVYHRDLKTKNIHIRPNYQLVMSHLWQHSEHDSFRYFSPEVIKNHSVDDDKSIDLSIPRAPTDVYAFSMVIYELLTGNIPFANMSNQKIKEVVCDKSQRPDMTQFETEYKQRSMSALVDLMKQCWAPNHLDRPDISDILRLLVRLIKLNGGDPRDNRADSLPNAYQNLQISDEVKAAKMDEETMNWLESVNAKRYIGNFCDYGVQTLEDVYHLTIDDPNALTTTIGMKSLQAKKFSDTIRSKVRPSLVKSPSASPTASPTGGPQRSDVSPPRMQQSPPRMDPATVEWLEITGGAKYTEAFLKHGVRNMDDLVYMAFEEPHEFIKSIGMRQLQASKFKDMLTNEQHPKSPRLNIRKTRSLRLDGNVNRERVERILRPDDDVGIISPNTFPRDDEDDDDYVPTLILGGAAAEQGEAPKIERSKANLETHMEEEDMRGGREDDE